LDTALVTAQACGELHVWFALRMHVRMEQLGRDVMQLQGVMCLLQAAGKAVAVCILHRAKAYFWH
jgi:hypothetical protein